MTDIGGFIIGKSIGGKKLTSLSPNKTIAGSFGGLFFSILAAFFYWQLIDKENFLNLLIISIITSVFSQIGDLAVSYLKRKAKIKNTGKFLPGHGGLLDRIDGILLGVPLGILTLRLLNH